LALDFGSGGEKKGESEGDRRGKETSDMRTHI
jgi:hypothetical protein